jgi:Protein kinase domain/PEGA domain
VGALGPVFRTYEPTRDRLVAVKVFRLDVTPEQAQSLADELSRAADAGLFHPSIVEPIAAGVEGTVAYRAEEYVAAETLDVAMRHYAPAALDKALPFITQLAGAIDFARAAGVGHGALHPRDIFVTPDEARATGFGVVDALERVRLRAPVRRPYSPPERIAGGAWSTPADVFSLAAIAYELLTARRPSGTGERIPPLEGANVAGHGAALHAVLARAMDDEPGKRFHSALAFAAALEGAGQGEQARDSTAAVAVVAAPERAGPPQAPKAQRADELERFAQAEQVEESDIIAERDEDQAHHDLSLREQAERERVKDEEKPGLFDEEAEADLAFAEAHPDRFADDFVSVKDTAPDAAHAPSLDIQDLEPVTTEYAESGKPGGFHTLEREVRDDSRAAALLGYTAESEPTMFRGAGNDRPRPAMLPVAIGVVIGLLIGFAAGYGVGGRDRAAPVSQATASQAPAPAPRTEPPAAKPYSEQQVARQPAPPPRTPPPSVPAEAPSPAAAPPAATPPAMATRGSIVVRSTPAGASVTLNGRWRGRTPLTLDRLQFGPYTVRVVQTGYAVAREEFNLSASQPAGTMDVRLRRSSAPPEPEGSPRSPSVSPSGARVGAIYIDSRPRGARVFIDGRAVGVTPLRLTDIAVGPHAIRLELAEHRTLAANTRVTAGEEARFTASLDPIR